MANGAEIRVSHFIPGRVRLRVPAIKGNPALAQKLQLAFSEVPGLTGLSYNTTTGSVLITYDTRRILAEDGGRKLKAVLHTHLPGLDADTVLHWLGTGGNTLPS